MARGSLPGHFCRSVPGVIRPTSGRWNRWSLAACHCRASCYTHRPAPGLSDRQAKKSRQPWGQWPDVGFISSSAGRHGNYRSLWRHAGFSERSQQEYEAENALGSVVAVVDPEPVLAVMRCDKGIRRCSGGSPGSATDPMLAQADSSASIGSATASRSRWLGLPGLDMISSPLQDLAPVSVHCHQKFL